MKTKVTGYLTQKHGFYYVVLNLPTDEKGKRNRKTLSTGLSTDRNATKAKALLLTMIREANARRGSAWCKRASTQKPKQNGR